MKKNYQKPAMKVVQLQHGKQLLQGSPGSQATYVRGNVFDGGISSDEEYNGDIR